MRRRPAPTASGTARQSPLASERWHSPALRGFLHQDAETPGPGLLLLRPLHPVGRGPAVAWRRPLPELPGSGPGLQRGRLLRAENGGHGLLVGVDAGAVL